MKRALLKLDLRQNVSQKASPQTSAYSIYYEAYARTRFMRALEPTLKPGTMRDVGRSLQNMKRESAEKNVAFANWIYRYAQEYGYCAWQIPWPDSITREILRKLDSLSARINENDFRLAEKALTRSDILPDRCL